MGACTTCEGTGWIGTSVYPPYKFCPACNNSGTDAPAQTEYDALIPPENPEYPWQPKDWQPLCYYCCQPIQLTKPWAGYRQRIIYGWEHVYPAVSDNPHIHGNRWHCDPAKVRENAERHKTYEPKPAHFERNERFVLHALDHPRCHVCNTQTSTHAGVCSAAGRPPFRAMTMSQKEDSLIKIFGWRGVKNG